MLRTFILKHLIQLKFLDGYRTYAAGIGSVATGVGILAGMFAGGTYDQETFVSGMAFLLGGVATIGAAGKADKAAENSDA